jgi:sec-independent protein translocase protein TatC
MRDPRRTETELDQARMPFGDHLEELRACVIRALIGVGVCTVLSLLFAKNTLTLIVKPAILVLRSHGEPYELLALSPQSGFVTYLKIGFFGGVLLSTPWVIYQVWLFVSSGLYDRERRWVKRFLPVTVALFLTGVGFMFYIVLPLVLNFFVTFNQSLVLPDVQPNAFDRLLLGTPAEDPAATIPDDPAVVPVGPEAPLDPQSGAIWYNTGRQTLSVWTENGWREVLTRSADTSRAINSLFGLQFLISLVFGLAIGFGVAFELPVLVVGLSATGIVSTQEMARSRRYVLFGIIVASAMLTPPDVVSQILMSVPMYVLFESGLWVARNMERSRASADS